MKIQAQEVKVEPINSKYIEVTLESPDMEFLHDIKVEDLLAGFDCQELFEKIIENDELILHDYLEKNGYIFNKA